MLLLGIASDPTMLRRTLCMIFKTNHLNSTKINSQEFVGLFKSEPKVERILKKLNECSLIEREHKIKSSLIDSKVKLNNKNLMFKEKDSTHIFKVSLGAFLQKKVPEAEKIVTINEHVDVITKWWISLEGSALNTAPVENIVKLFVNLGLATDRNDSRNLIFLTIRCKELNNPRRVSAVICKKYAEGCIG